jgi:hypothetical protein
VLEPNEGYCPAIHPEKGLQCEWDVGKRHEQHLAYEGRDEVRWPNEGFIAPVEDGAHEMVQVANQIPRSIPVEPPDPTTLARREDPWSSHLAAERIAPSVNTRMEEVLTRLLAAEGEWVDAPELAHEGCGGSEGLRRVRQLRADLHWPVERRPHPERRTAWQYRIRPESL